MSDQETTTSGENYEERLRQLEKEKKGLVGDLADKREKIRSLESRLINIEETLTSAGQEDGETAESRVNRLAQDPDGYIGSHLIQFEESQIKPLRQELEMLKIDRKIERALRWVAKQEKSDYEEVAGSDLEQDLARITQEMRNRGIVPTDPEEGTKEAYRLLKQERSDKESREKEREGKIDGNRTENVSQPSRTGSRRWTRADIDSMSISEFTKNESEIKRQFAEGLIK